MNTFEQMVEKIANRTDEQLVADLAHLTGQMKNHPESGTAGQIMVCGLIEVELGERFLGLDERFEEIHVAKEADALDQLVKAARDAVRSGR